MRGVLRSMADAMVQSAFSAPHAAVWVRLDATKTMELLAALKQRPSLSNVRLSPLTIVAMALCDAARHFPGVNSSFDTAAGEVVVRRTVNLGIAADTPRGLIVPNIKAADELDLVGMAQALNVLVDKARNGTTTPNEMIGTTITITNVGPFGVDAAMPILPPGTGRFSQSVRSRKHRGSSTTKWSCARWPRSLCPSTTARWTERSPHACSDTSLATLRTPRPR